MGILWVLVIGMIAYLYFKNNDMKANGGGESPMDTAKKRYARGEINHEEFEQMKKDLQ
jgi:uncharacterized membrane protein